MRELFRESAHYVPDSGWLIFLAKENSRQASFSSLREEFVNLITRIDVSNGENTSTICSREH